MFTHLAVADEPDDPYTADQLARVRRRARRARRRRARRRRRPRRQLGRRRWPTRRPALVRARRHRPVRHLARARRRRPGRRPAPGAVAAGPGVVRQAARRRRARSRTGCATRSPPTPTWPPCRSATPTACGAGLSQRRRRADRRPPPADRRHRHDGPADGRLRRRRRARRRRGGADRRARATSGSRAEEWAGRLGTIGYEIVCGIGAARPAPARSAPAAARRSARNIGASCRRRPACTLRVASLDGTHAVAAALAGLSRAGDIILLAGEMGAGKTAFAQGFGRALGVTEPITSPTFTLVHSYDTGGADAAPRRPLPPRAARRGRRPGARRAGRVRRHRARRVGRRRRVDVRRAPRRAPRRSSTTTLDARRRRRRRRRPDVGRARSSGRALGDGARRLLGRRARRGRGPVSPC